MERSMSGPGTPEHAGERASLPHIEKAPALIWAAPREIALFFGLRPLAETVYKLDRRQDSTLSPLISLLFLLSHLDGMLLLAASFERDPFSDWFLTAGSGPHRNRVTSRP